MEMREMWATGVAMQGNQAENVRIVVEITYNSNGYSTFKEWREFKIK